MSKIELDFKFKFLSAGSSDDYQVLSFKGPDILSPADLVGLELPQGLNNKIGIVISGRGPVWLYAYLVHLCHPFPWVATHDPRLGYVVVASHSPKYKPGDVIEDN